MFKKFKAWTNKQKELSAKERAFESLSIHIIKDKLYILVKGQPVVLVENPGETITKYNELVNMFLDADL